MTLTQEHRRQLDEDGCLSLPGFFEPRLRERITSRIEELFAAEGEASGGEFRQEEGCRRLANLADKGEVFREMIDSMYPNGKRIELFARREQPAPWAAYGNEVL